MSIRPILLCGAGLVALQLLAVHAATVTPVDPPAGWSVSDSIGKQYVIGYDAREKAYFIENTGPIGPAGKAINAETVPYAGGRHVPYSSTGLKESDPWAASLLQSVKAAPYRHHKLRLEAEVKTPAGFKGQLSLMLRGQFPNNSTTTNTTPAASHGWQTVAVEIEEIPGYEPKTPDDTTISFGILMQGEGRVLVRGMKLSSLPYSPEKPVSTHLQDVFSDPPAGSEPVNLELRR